MVKVYSLPFHLFWRTFPFETPKSKIKNKDGVSIWLDPTTEEISIIASSEAQVTWMILLHLESSV